MRKWLFGGVAVSSLAVFVSGPLSRLKSDYADAGGLRENKRYGWVRRT